MAKKRKRNEAAAEETYEFVAPTFDEKEFILKDIYGTKVLLIVSLLAVIVGVLAACLSAVTSLWWIGVILMAVVLVAFKPLLGLFRFRADLLDLKMMLGNYVLFVLLVFGVWIVMINPPFLFGH